MYGLAERAEETAETRPREHAPRANLAAGHQRGPMLVRIAFGIIWTIDAWFKWQPDFQRNFMKMVQAGAESQPGWLGPWYRFWEAMLQPFAPFFAIGTAVIETVIATALLLGFARKPFYLVGALWSFGIWAIPEGFGNMSRTAYTDIGTSIIYVTVFAALWALDACAGPQRASLDALIERRFPGWKLIAEVRDSRQRRMRAMGARRDERIGLDTVTDGG